MKTDKQARPDIPMSSPDLTAAERRLVNQVLETRHLSRGPKIADFERKFANHLGAKHAVGVSSGTTGLHLCVVAAGVGDGDLVVTTPFSFIASANVMLYERAVPVFVDIDPMTLNVDADQLVQAVEALAEGGKKGERERWLPRALRGTQPGIRRLKAVLPVHAFGQPADMDPIAGVARKHGIVVIEDACEALGAEYKGRKAGRLGEVAVFAFYPNKQMTTGEGGMIVTDRDDWATLFRSLRNQGRDSEDGWLSHTRLGYNYRLTELSAALGLAQLGRIDELLAKRERVANWYREQLKGVEGVETPHIADTTSRISWFVYVVRLAPEFERHAVMAALAERGIPSRPYFTPIHLQPFYRERFGYQEGDFPETEAAARSMLALPFFGNMTLKQVKYVCENMAAILERR
jgi:dTDP-4-amino-4,6-dideoxygalactose transaminase